MQEIKTTLKGNSDLSKLFSFEKTYKHFLKALFKILSWLLPFSRDQIIWVIVYAPWPVSWEDNCQSHIQILQTNHVTPLFARVFQKNRTNRMCIHIEKFSLRNWLIQQGRLAGWRPREELVLQLKSKGRLVVESLSLRGSVLLRPLKLCRQIHFTQSLLIYMLISSLQIPSQHHETSV